MFKRPIGFSQTGDLSLAQGLAQERIKVLKRVSYELNSKERASPFWRDLQLHFAKNIICLQSLEGKASKQHDMMTAIDAKTSSASEYEIVNAIKVCQEVMDGAVQRVMPLLEWNILLVERYFDLAQNVLSEESSRWFHKKAARDLSFLLGQAQKMQQTISSISRRLQVMYQLACSLSAAGKDKGAKPGYLALNLRLLSEETKQIIQLMNLQMADMQNLGDTSAQFERMSRYYEKRNEPLMQELIAVIFHLQAGFRSLAENLSRIAWKEERKFEKD